MTPTITAFERSPDRGKGLARDMRVRSALEEVQRSGHWRLSLQRRRRLAGLRPNSVQRFDCILRQIQLGCCKVFP